MTINLAKINLAIISILEAFATYKSAKLAPTTMIAKGKLQVPSISSGVSINFGIKIFNLNPTNKNPINVAITGGLNKLAKEKYFDLLFDKKCTPQDQITRLNPNKNRKR